MNKLLLALGLIIVMGTVGAAGAGQPGETFLPIGQIQGAGDTAAAVGQEVSFRGLVTGVLEDQNASGIRFYTVFVQDVPGGEDGDPATSDGIPVFLGRDRPAVALGDVVQVRGEVTEFFGLTEIDDAGLELQVESQGNPLPPPLEIEPPAGNEAAAAYFEPYEGMHVAVAEAIVVGPLFSGCGYAVVRADSGLERVFRHAPDDPIGQVIPVLHTSDVDCRSVPPLAAGDHLTGLAGPLTYHFDQFKIVHQAPAGLAVMAAPRPEIPPPPLLAPGQVSLATYNLHDYFDLVDDTGDEAEPKPSAAGLAVKQAKLIHAISQSLGCPAVLGIQEVEKESLLLELAGGLAEACGFTYQVSHRESADARGIDVALLTDPRRVTIEAVELRQGCTSVDTDVSDPLAACPAGQDPLFDRPPLEVQAIVEGRPFVFLVNHFKSKREGEAETEPERLAQAEHVSNLVAGLLAEASDAAIVVMGDFNDYDRSDVMLVLAAGGQLDDVLQRVPAEERYSYVFSGVSQLLDGILVSPALVEQVAAATIIHANADFPYTLAEEAGPAGLPYGSSDHDVPLVVLQLDTPAIATAVPTVTATPPTLPGTTQTTPSWLAALVALACVSMGVVAAAFYFLRRRR
ncbi:MAG: hypothetical protein L0332_29270 [Chloroflexi bacterium]|nr:hypothetical protein [Chloroflexota bacterium]